MHPMRNFSSILRMRSINCPESTADGAKSPTNYSARNIVQDVKSKTTITLTFWRFESKHDLLRLFWGTLCSHYSELFHVFQFWVCMCTLFGGILGHHKNWPKGSYARPEQMRDDDTDFAEPSVFFNFLCMDISPIYWWYGWLPWVMVELILPAAIVVPSRRSVLLEVHDDIILLRICLYYVFNDCTKTGSTRVTGRIQLQRGLVYVTGVWNPGPRNGNLFTILIVNRNNISKKCFYLRFISIYSFSPLKSRFLFFE